MGKLIKQLGAFSVGPIVGAIISFVTIPVITYFISPDEYGRSSMFVLAQGTLSMLMYLGMDQAYIREYNLYEKEKNKLISNAIIIPAIVVILLSTCIVINYKFVSIVLFDNPNETLAVLALAVMLPFMVIENFSLLRIRMEEKGLQYSVFTIMLKVFNLLFTVVLFLFYEKSFRSVVLATAIAEIVNGILLLILSIKSVRVSFKMIDKKLIKNMLKYGLPLVPASLLFWALTSMDKIMLRVMCDYTELGLYSAAFKIVNALAIVQTCFTLFWTPVALRWYENGIKKIYFETTTKVVATVMVALCMIILLFKTFVAFILGNEFSKAIYIFPFLLLQPIMYTISEATAVGITFTRKTWCNIITAALASITNIVLNYMLIPLLGGEGAAIATGMSYIVFFWTRTLISRRLWYKFKIQKYIIYSVLVLFNCLLHTFIKGFIPYIVTIISIVLLVIANIKDIKEIITIIKKNDI